MGGKERTGFFGIVPNDSANGGGVAWLEFFVLHCEHMFSYDEYSKRPGESVSPLQGYPGRYVGQAGTKNNDAQQSSKGVEAG